MDSEVAHRHIGLHLLGCCVDISDFLYLHTPPGQMKAWLWESTHIGAHHHQMHLPQSTARAVDPASVHWRPSTIVLTKGLAVALPTSWNESNPEPNLQDPHELAPISLFSLLCIIYVSYMTLQLT